MAAPTYDAVSSGGINGTSLTVAHTCGGSNRVLYVCTINGNAGGAVVSGVTYNAVAMTRISTVNTMGGAGTATMQIWRLIAPASGANNIVATCSASRHIDLIGISFSDADQTTPEGAVVEEADFSVDGSITTDQILLGYAGSYDGAGAVSAFTTSGTNQTERADLQQNILCLTGSTQTGSGTVTSVWSATGGTVDNSCGMVVPVNGVLPPSAPTYVPMNLQTLRALNSLWLPDLFLINPNRGAASLFVGLPDPPAPSSPDDDSRRRRRMF